MSSSIGRAACSRCGEPVILEGNIQDIDGFMENPAPNASAVAAPSLLLPCHWRCSQSKLAAIFASKPFKECMKNADMTRNAIAHKVLIEHEEDQS